MEIVDLSHIEFSENNLYYFKLALLRNVRKEIRLAGLELIGLDIGKKILYFQ